MSASAAETLSLPETMRAIKIVEGHMAEIQEVPLPEVREGYVLVKVRAVALNPTDWKHIAFVGRGGETLGVDLCGTVVSSSSSISNPLAPGTRITAFSHGGNSSQHGDGAFGDYAIVKSGLGLRVPDNVSDHAAATLSVGILTCGQALYQSLKLPLPTADNDAAQKSFAGTWVMIYGASTASGSLAVQYAKLSGAKVVATCSPRNFEMITSLGADEVFDYNDPECSSKIRAVTHDGLTLVLDCIAEKSSPTICENAVSSHGGGKISYLLQAKHARRDVEVGYTLGYTVCGEAFEKVGMQFPAKPEDYEFAKKFFELSEGLLREGKLRPHPVEKDVGGRGWEGVMKGLEELKEGRVSGKKLTYTISE